MPQSVLKPNWHLELMEDRHSMTTKKGSQSDATKGSQGAAQQPKKQKAPYTARYVAVDSHLSERHGSTDSVTGLAGERPAGRKLAQDLANVCNQLYSEGYEVFSVLPVTSGRAVEATVESEERVPGRTYSRSIPQESTALPYVLPSVVPHNQNKHYVDTGVGYSVTDGVLIIGRKQG